MKRILLSLMILGLIAVSQMALAQPGDFDSRPMFRMEKMLDLTDEQEAKIEDLRLNFQKERLLHRSRIQELRTNLKLELIKEGYDQKKVNQIVDEMEGLRKDLQKKRINHLRDVRNMLTDDQKKTFDMHILSGHIYQGDRGGSHRGTPHTRMRGRGRF